MKWTTKDGRKIAVRDMADSHLENALRFVKRARNRAEAECNAAAGYDGDGDGAKYEADMAADQAANKILLCDYWTNVFILELARRRLDREEPEWMRP